MLALGACAEGCGDGLLEHLPTLYPFLSTLMASPKPLVRSIATWTVSRFVCWVVEDARAAALLPPLLQQLLQLVVDNNKKVQEAGCSALSTTMEAAGTDLIRPYAPAILECFHAAFAKYQTKNMPNLYDSVSTLASVMGEELNGGGLVQRLMPPLVARWEAVADTDKQFVALLECFTQVRLCPAASPPLLPTSAPAY